MAFYMYTGNYTAQAVRALVKEPQDRASAAQKIVEAAGGTLHHAFAAFGAFDVMILAELPDDVDVAAVSLAVGAAGGVTNGRITKLLTMPEFRAALEKAGAISGTYSPPQG